MKNNQIILGIETSCDDTSIAIIKNTRPVKILSYLNYGQEETLKKWGGVVPEIAARNHLEKIAPTLDEAFKAANIKPSEVDLISVTTYPGLLGPLLTGVNAAKTLALLFQKPILPANHLLAHLEAINIDQSVPYPYLGILLSGGHSLFILMQSSQEYIILGGTIDDACGEAFDKGGKLLELGYPAGYIIDKLSKFGDQNKYTFPIGLKNSANAQMSFSGLKTSLRVFLDKNPSVLLSKPSQFKEKEDHAQIFYDVCACYQSAITKAILLKLKYAIKKVKEDFGLSNLPIVLGGGVARNSQIRSELVAKYSRVHCVNPEYCTDNGAMIANYGVNHYHNAVPYPDCLKLDAKNRFIINKEKNESIP